MGSGFFVTPHTIMTNRHVIENSKDGKVIVVSRALTTLHRGTVLRSTVSSDIGAADFALIRLDQGSAPGVLPFASTVRKLNDVIAAGYPALTVQTDSSFRRLLGGDLAAAPDLNLTAGVVQAIQEMRTGLQQVLHTAQISSGNSGGPLVDRCGRVVGVNTFINRDKDDVARANYALHSKAAVAFLAATGVPIRPTSSTCG
jgi:serine protease Do